nr:spike protein [Megaderma bat coronavirus]
MKLLLVLLSCVTVTHCCSSVNLDLFNSVLLTSKGLINATTVVTGAFPSTNFSEWYCDQWTNVNDSTPDGLGTGIGFYAQTADTDYVSGGQGGGGGYTISVSPTKPNQNSWQLWLHRKWGQSSSVTVRLCKWFTTTPFNATNFGQDATQGSAYECLINGTYPSHKHLSYMFGITWYNDFVRVVFPPTVLELQLQGLLWEVVRFTSPISGGKSTKFNVVKDVSSVLVHTDAGGNVTKYVYCGDGFVNSLQCKHLTFSLASGVYSNTEVEYPSAIYTVTHNMTVCPDVPLFPTTSNLIKRLVFSNCVVNYTTWVSNVTASPHLTLPNGHFNPFTECSGVNHIVGNCVPAFVLRYSLGVSTDDTVKTPFLVPGSCFGWEWLDRQNKTYKWWIAEYVSNGAFVCQHNPESPTVDKCVTYTVEKTTFQGVLKHSNYTLSQFYNVLYVGAQVKYVRILGQVYEVQSCYEASYDVLYHNNATYGLLYRSFDCAHINSMRSRANMRAINENQGTPTSIGCLFNAQYAPNDTMVNCTQPLGGGLCADLTTNVSVRRIGFDKRDTTYVAPVLSERYVDIPVGHQLVMTEQFLQTTMPKFDVNCETYICDVSVKCKMLLNRYGGFCQKVESDIRGSGNLLDGDISSLYSTIAARSTSQHPVTDGFNVSQYFLPKDESSSNTGRSFIEDLLFSKIETTGPGFYKDYYDCKKNAIQDLTCAQYHNGILVIPPIMDAETLGMYGGIAAASVSLGLFGGQAGITTWSTAISARLNALGVVQNALADDVQKLATGFNQLTASVSKLASTTSSALQAIQAVVNQNAAQVEALVNGISENFGAISSNFKILSERLDRLEADVQMDRLINGRMNVLQLFVTNYKLKVAELRNTHKYVQSIINECVYAQSLRNGFCGQGLHVFSLMQNAPGGIMFFHYSLIPNNTITVKTTPGLCETDQIGSKCIVAKNGVFVSANLSYWQWSPRNVYKPENLTAANVIEVTRGANYTTLNDTFDIPGLNNSASFDDEFNQHFNNMSSQLQALNNLTANLNKLNISEQIKTLNVIAYNVSNMKVEVEKLQKFTQYIKWSWWQWLLIAAGLTLLAGVMLWCCLATGCCGMCGCLSATCATCCDCRGTKLKTYELEKVHTQ